MSEIIEIGLAVVDLDARERVARHRIMVRPTRSEVSAFCTGLTGITPAQAARGVGLAEALDILVRASWASWGDHDRGQFLRQCAADGVAYPFGHPAERAHTNAKAVLADARGLRRRPGMARALELAGLLLEGRHHRGVDDAWNIAALVLDLVDGGAWPDPA